jgi:uncharacterized protein (TIGR02246 family)
MSEDDRAIRNLIETWMTATRAGDHAKVLSLMTDDVVFLVPGQAPFGKEAFAVNSQALKDARIDGKSDVQEIIVAGDWAFCRTHLVVAMTPPNGEVTRRSGHTLTILRKERDGQWRVARDANLLTKQP